MKKTFVKLAALCAVVAMSTAVAYGDAFEWTGTADGTWTNTGNWLQSSDWVNCNPATRAPGQRAGNENDWPIFGPASKSGSNSNPMTNTAGDDRVSGFIFTGDGWNVNLGTRWMKMGNNGIVLDVRIVGVDGTATVSGGGGILFPNSCQFRVEPGDKLVLNSTMKPSDSSAARTESFIGGGTVVSNGGEWHENRVINYNVKENSTLINNNALWSNGGGSCVVDAGSVVAGNGTFITTANTINGTISPSTGNSNTGVGTLSFNNGSSVPYALTVNGTYAADTRMA